MSKRGLMEKKLIFFVSTNGIYLFLYLWPDETLFN